MYVDTHQVSHHRQTVLTKTRSNGNKKKTQSIQSINQNQKKIQKEKRERKNSRLPIRRSTRRSCSATLADGVRRTQGAADVVSQAGDDGGRGTAVVLHVGLGPAGEGDAGLEGVDL